MTRSRSSPRWRSVLALALVGVVCGAWTWLDVVDEDVQAGNQAFAAGRFDDALVAYERALARAGDDARVHYNIGVALYELARPADGDADDQESAGRALLDRAGAAFARAATASAERGDAMLAAMAHVGHGNALYGAARYQDAVRAYQDALRANPGHDDARYNLQIALAHLDEQRPPGQHGAGPRGHGPEDRRTDRNGAGERGQSGQRDGIGQEAGDARQPGGGGQADAAGGQGSATGESGDRGAGQPAGSGQATGARAGERGEDTDADDIQDAGGEDGDGGEDDGKAGARSRPADGTDARSSSPRDLDKKLDALERLSRDLRHGKLRRDARRQERGRIERDW